ncbi:IclR family transcriptional regulator [Lentzea sp. JNUCC 0626]|uniref:IclR family transcriptional regulator n=1 Tax=Lentzea sp. JNUCC 0626 TaxID=3367513 RepID=UPI003749A4B7
MEKRVTDEPAVSGTQSVFRALSILHAFTADRPTLTGPEVADLFGYSVPTAYRLLRALEAENFLVFHRTTRAYGPGPEILRLAGVMLHRDALVAHTQTSLVRLRALTGETVAIYWRLGNRCTCTQEIARPESVEAGIGADFPLTRGAAGKALLLHLAENEIRALLDDPDVPAPPGGADALLADLRASRERGYTISAGEIAAPLPWAGDELAAYSVRAPEARFGRRERDAAGRTLVDEMARLRAILHDQVP